MTTDSEKMHIVQDQMFYIQSINKVLYDAILYGDLSKNCDYISMIEIQNKYINVITELF